MNCEVSIKVLGNRTPAEIRRYGVVVMGTASKQAVTQRPESGTSRTVRPIPEDVLHRIERDFGASLVSVITNRLAFLDQELVVEHRERLLRCIVFLAGGQTQKLDSCIDLCRHD